MSERSNIQGIRIVDESMWQRLIAQSEVKSREAFSPPQEPSPSTTFPSKRRNTMPLLSASFDAKERIKSSENGISNEFIDVVDKSAFEMYLQEIGRIPVYSRREEVAAFTQYNNLRLSLEKAKERQETVKIADLEKQVRDQRNAIVERNLRLVVHVAKWFGRSKVPLEDLVGAGNFGLIKSVEKFDVSKGFTFSTYAVRGFIFQKIQRYIDDHEFMIRLPIYLRQFARQVTRTERSLSVEFDEEEIPSEVIAQRLGVKVEDVDNIKKIMRKIQVESFDRPLNDEGDTLLRVLEEKEVNFEEGSVTSMDQIKRRDKISQMLRDLVDEEVISQRGMAIVKMRYGLDDGRKKTLEEVGKAFCITRERVRQVEAKVKRLLKKRIEQDQLYDEYVMRDPLPQAS